MSASFGSRVGRSVLVAGLFVLAGCGPPADDTATPLDEPLHTHVHFHGEGEGHGHTHPDGAASPHSHEHRHGPY